MIMLNALPPERPSLLRKPQPERQRSTSAGGSHTTRYEEFRITGSGGRRRRRTRKGTSPTSYVDCAPAADRAHALRAPRRAARPCPADRTPRPDPALPNPPADAGTQEARQRDRRRVRTRALLLPLGSRDRPTTQADSPPARVGRRRAPKSAGTRDNAMGSPNQAMPVLRHASAGDETRDLGCQPPHMRLTDVEDAPDASPREPKPLKPTGKRRDNERCSLDKRSSI